MRRYKLSLWLHHVGSVEGCKSDQCLERDTKKDSNKIWLWTHGLTAY